MTVLKNQQECLENWKKGMTSLKSSMTLGGTLQFTGNKDKALESLKRVELASKKTGLEVQETLPTEATPEESDFLEVTYRALSAALLGDRPIDFSNEGMLKKSVSKLVAQTVYKDHYTSVDNWVGTVKDAFWDKDTKDLPPGINAILKLDLVKDPMLARGVVQGAIHSASVTVSFEWKPSHPKLMEDNIFFNKLGDDVDGEMVRIIVTGIEKFWEISLVWQGADEYAKQIGKDGKPIGMSAQAETLSLSKSKENDMDLLKEYLAQFYQVDEIKEDNYKELLAKLSTDAELKGKNAVIAEFEAKKVEMQAEFDKKLQAATDLAQLSITKIDELNKTIAELKVDAEAGKAYLAAQRAEAVRLYKLSKNDNVSEVILKTLETANLEITLAWKETFQKETDEKFPLHCKKCNSTEVSRQSSATKKEELDKTKQVVDKDEAEKLRALHS